MAYKLDSYRTDFEDLVAGATMRVNHTECQAGEDTRRRLYLTRPVANPAIVIGYCHNCQDNGIHVGTKWSSYRDHKHSPSVPVPPTVKDVVEEPLNLVRELDHWPTNAKSWAYSNHIDQVDIDHSGIAYDPSSDRVYLPRYYNLWMDDLTSSHLKGYQLRNINNNNQPKYFTVTKSDDLGYTKVLDTACNYKYTCIVEDLVSALHIYWALRSDVEVIVNYGTKINLEALDSMSQGDRVVWLDNDSSHVSFQAGQMAKTLDLLHGDHYSTTIVSDHSDPKHYSREQIREVFSGLN